MLPVLTVFANSPDQGRGLARDMRVRWALEEVGQPYTVRPVSFAEMRQPAHQHRQPFGQIPTYEEGDITLFESGAIVLHIAEHHAGLLPDSPPARATALSWLFAALNTVEPPIVEREQVAYAERERPWYEARVPLLDERIRGRLDDLSVRLGEGTWLDEGFTAGDLLMVTVLRRLEGTGILEGYAKLGAYVARGQARPAYQRAFAAQRQLFMESAKAGDC
ncbi:glutathione S-transferase family protein [Haematobacter massiliensis]|uniref:Glutathione S-transferase n=1 Tax=Haematobacter massiliensis TaxID=195105 RepID=A0A086YB74_9RHOB|nr:glutathione S-transferase family protein [Haematobacter massiliensis]KFI31524.1 glutathione S-transferase [Haematobacter massiliensis]OWJ71584.1 glutathione S-transferase family protein [Haematobacter massiliensis]OWJ88021.1 glutathione S-transferase family protein [Haematobacter massiliensis]QBJ23598.1 glutathione S-transferase family protein [Haematobacter massiliensis]